MGSQSEPQWKPHAVAAGILILDALVIGVAPSGPWDDSVFQRANRSCGGMLSLCVLVSSNIQRKGLVPWTDLWEKPEESARLVLFSSIGFLAISWVAGNPMQPHLPDPTGLILVLVGLLLGLQGIYVYLVIGPLKEE